MKDKFIYLGIIHDAPWVIIQRKDNPINWKNFEDLSKLIAGNVNGVELRPGIKELAQQKKIKFDEVSSDSINLLRLGMGRVDFVMMDSVVFRYNMATNKALRRYKNKCEIHPKAIAITSYGLALRKTEENKTIIDRFNESVTTKKFSKHMDCYLGTYFKK